MESDSGLLRGLKVPFVYSGSQAVTVSPDVQYVTLYINPELLRMRSEPMTRISFRNRNPFAGIRDLYE